MGSLCGRGVEVVVIAGGPGARSDLAAFDSHELARAVLPRAPCSAHWAKPPDRTLCDKVAHAVLPTPSSVAAGLVARAEAQGRRAEAAAVQQRQAEQLSKARRRSRAAVVVALGGGSGVGRGASSSRRRRR